MDHVLALLVAVVLCCLAFATMTSLLKAANYLLREFPTAAIQAKPAVDGL
jgi:hypothetical protein